MTDDCWYAIKPNQTKSSRKALVFPNQLRLKFGANIKEMGWLKKRKYEKYWSFIFEKLK